MQSYKREVRNKLSNVRRCGNELGIVHGLDQQLRNAQDTTSATAPFQYWIEAIRHFKSAVAACPHATRQGANPGKVVRTRPGPREAIP